MSETLELRLLGHLEIRQGGEPVTKIQASKTLALLSYLAVTARPHTRPALAGLLWGGMPEAKARGNLSKALSTLRRVVGDHLIITRQTVTFNGESDFWLDVAAFEAGVRDNSIEQLQEAVRLYEGDFLDGFYVRNAPEFEDWDLAQQARLKELALRALHTLATHFAGQGDTGRAQAVDYIRRLLALEPWREEAHRQMMLLLALGRQRSPALAQYETCRQILAEELGVEPGPETVALYEQIRDDTLNKIAPSRLAAPQMSSPPQAITLPSFLRPDPTRPPEIVKPNFVAREQELAYLDEMLAVVLTGQGRVSFVTGEPGSGKTALVQEFARQAQQKHPDLVVALGNCNAHIGIGDPYLPFREILELLTGDVEERLAAGMISQTQAQRLWQLMPTSIPTLIEVGPQLIDTFVTGSSLIARAEMFGSTSAPWLTELQARPAHPAQQSPPLMSQTALFSQYTRVLQRLAHRQPVLLVLDDLHWADTGSISLLFHLGRHLGPQSIWVVGVYRPSDLAVGRERERHPLEAVVNEFQQQFGHVPLNLDQSEGRGFIEAFLETEPNHLGSAFREALYHLTRGHALFTIEILRGLQERGDLVRDEAGHWIEGATIDWQTLPARVEGIIKERIARLPAAWQETLKIASVEGEAFTAGVVAQVQAVDERQMIRRLSRLDRQHHLLQSHSSPQTALVGQRVSGFRFRHNLFQQYLYQSLSQGERMYFHDVTGQVLEELYNLQPEQIALRLARHFQEAGVVDKAITYLHQAGERANRLVSYQETVANFSEALSLLRTLPDTTRERIQQELTLQIGLSNALMKTKGISSPDMKQALDRARALCAQVGDTPQIYPVWQGLYWLYQLRAELDTTLEVAEHLLLLAEQQQNPLFFLPAHLSAAVILLFRGELAQAHRHFEQCFRLDDPQHYQAYLLRFGQNPMVACLVNSALNLWYLGFPDQALKQSYEGVKLAKESSHIYDQAYTLYCASWIHQLRREAQATQAQAEAVLDLSIRHDFPFWLAQATILRGWALVEQGQTEAGLADLRQGLADLQALGVALLRPYFLALLSEAYAKIGQVDEGLAWLTEALTIVDRTKERQYEAELHRLRGELLLRTEAKAEAEHHFRQAIEIARKQQAKSLELRAVMSLSRLWQRHGKPAEARQILAEVYGWFNEGFDTPDLKEARALLEELS